MGSFSNPMASYSESTFTPDGLVLSLDDLLSRKVTILTGQNLARGAVLGQITLGAAVSAAKAGGNTGNGTLVLDAVTPILANAYLSGPGVYTVRCINAGANTAIFDVVDPRGITLGQVTYNGAGASATFADRLKFAVTDGGVDFVVGDGFDITIAAGSGKYVLSLAAAVDGSQLPDAILSQATDATAADTDAMGYFRGRFSSAAVVLGAGQTVAGIREGLRGKGIDLVDVIA
ncbi:MAG TPA: head decoration protein [Candidatus Limnocylindrales bacterium]|jgi:hypothetical protein|nr:head decoration protein [Candidatus Limnocylindrales bacterium]